MAAPIPSDVARDLCLACGLCCNGVLFKDVELRPRDRPATLRDAGLPLRKARGGTVLPQPCPALGPGNRCEIYGKHPTRCQQFECALFQEVAGGVTGLEEALRTVRSARRRSAHLQRLLGAAGDENVQLPLQTRLRQVQRRFEQGSAPSAAAAAAYGDLTVASHALDVLLSSRFYSPGS